MSMRSINIQFPEEVLISLKEDEAEFAREMKMLAAVKLFELGKLSSGRAVQLAGVSRVEFLLSLGRYKVPPFYLSPEELERDIRNA